MLCSNSFKTIWLEPFCNTSEDETGTFCHFREFPANSCRLPWQVMFESFCPSIAWSSEVKLKSRSWKFSFPKRWMMQYGWKTYGFRCLKKFKCVKIQGNITPRPLSSPCLIKPVSPESELELSSSPNSTKWLTQMDDFLMLRSDEFQYFLFGEVLKSAAGPDILTKKLKCTS